MRRGRPPLKWRTILLHGIAALLCLCLIGGACLLGMNAYVIGHTRSRLHTVEELSGFGADCVLILGCGVNGDRPSHMLEDRLLVGISLYEQGAAQKLLMSGDHGSSSYNEVGVMKTFAVRRGVPSADVFMDHAGFSTYESLVRARDIFGVRRVVIVSQEYHLYRALYLADCLGIEAWGVASDLRSYVMSWRWKGREIIARGKDLLFGHLQPATAYPGEAIPITGDGDLTNDEDFWRLVSAPNGAG